MHQTGKSHKNQVTNVTTMYEQELQRKKSSAKNEIQLRSRKKIENEIERETEKNSVFLISFAKVSR